MQGRAATLDWVVNQEFPSLKFEYKTAYDELSSSWKKRNFGQIAPAANTYTLAAHRFAKDYLVKEFFRDYQKLYDLFDSTNTFNRRRKLFPAARKKLKIVKRKFQEIGFYMPIGELRAVNMIEDIEFFAENKLSKSPSRYFNNPNCNLAKYHNLFTQLAWNLDTISKEAHAIGWENPSTNGYFLTISERAQRLSAAFKTKLVEYMPEQYEVAK